MILCGHYALQLGERRTSRESSPLERNKLRSKHTYLALSVVGAATNRVAGLLGSGLVALGLDSTGNTVTSTRQALRGLVHGRLLGVWSGLLLHLIGVLARDAAAAVRFNYLLAETLASCVRHDDCWFEVGSLKLCLKVLLLVRSELWSLRVC